MCLKLSERGEGDGNSRDNVGGVESSYSSCVTTGLSIN